MADYSIKEIYQGGYSSLDSNYGNKIVGNIKTNAGSFALTTDPRNANFLQEVSTKLQSGVQEIEVEAVSPQVFDSVPQQHLKEINRLSKLTGVGISMHGPVIDTAGINQQGYSELNREASERVIINSLMRGHDLNPKGNIKVNFHSAEGIPGSELEMTKEGPKYKKLLAVNRDSGKMAPLEVEKKYYPDMKKRKPGITQEYIEKLEEAGTLKESDVYTDISLKEGKKYTPEKRIAILNDSEWDNSINQLFFNKERADEILEKNRVLIQHIAPDIEAGKIDRKTLSQIPEQREAFDHYRNAKTYLDDVHQQIYSLFSKAYEYGSDKQKEALQSISGGFKKALEKDKSIFGQTKAMNELLHGLKNSQLAPEMYVPIEQFAAEKSSKTYGNAAFEAYKKFKDTSPVVLIENPPAGFALSSGKDLKNLIIKSREQFMERAQASKEEGGLELSKGDAKKQADKLIGATWDVGHINMMRKMGYTEKDIIKETENIADLVKHVHLSDNFGLEHTELPMGMGNVPLKGMLEALKKEGVDVENITKVIEAGNWFQHFKTPPVQESLEAFGTPIYAMSGGGPTWNQSIGLQQGYFSGYGEMLPSINYNTFGAGFSRLPSELGGQQQGGGNRMSGAPME